MLNSNLLYKILFAIFLCLAFILSHSFDPIYTSGQTAHLVRGLAEAGYGSLSNDWLLTTSNNLFFFSLLIKYTYIIFGEIFFYIYFFILLAIYFIFLSLICNHFLRNKSEIIFFLICSFIIFCHSKFSINWFLDLLGIYLHGPLFYEGSAGTYLLGSVFQPGVFGVFLLASIYFFIVRKPYIASCFIGLTCIMHPTYLFSGAVITFSYIFLLYRREKKLLNLVKFSLFSLFLVSPILFLTISILTNNTFSQEALNIQINFRAPHHHLIKEWFGYDDIIKIVIILLSLLVTYKKDLFYIIFFPFLFASFFTLFEFYFNTGFLSVLMPWRVSALLMPLSFFLLSSFTINLLLKRYIVFLERKKLTIQLLIFSFLIYFSFIGANQYLFMATHYENKNYTKMMQFVLNNKNNEDTYLIPTNLDEFRLRTGKPVFVDFHASPQNNQGKLEWYNRIKKTEKINELLNERNCELLLNEISANQFTHMVLFASQDIECEFLEKEYKDDYYIITKIIN